MPEKSDFYVYAWFRCGVPIYVGKGSGKRISRPLTRVAHNPHLQRVLQNEPQNVVRQKLFEGLTEDEAFALEIETIKRIGREPNGPLFNLTDGGDGVRKMSDESKAKHLAKCLARKQSGETREKIRLLRTGSKAPAEVGQKISEALKGRKHSPEHVEKRAAQVRGKKHSEEQRKWRSEFNRNRVVTAETRAKMSEAHKGRPMPDKTREKFAACNMQRKLAAQAQSVSPTNPVSK